MSRFSWLILVGTVLLAGCGGFGKKVVLSASDQATYATLSIEEILNEQQGAIAQARTEQLTIFSPKNLDRAAKSFEEASALAAKSKGRDEILRNVVLSKRYLDQGYEVKRILNEQFGDLFMVDGFLQALNAPVEYEKVYTALARRLSDVIEDVEEEKLDGALSKRGPLLADMEALEIRATLAHALGPAKTVLDAAVNEMEFDELAPQTHQDALRVYAESEAAISADPRNQAAVDEAGQRALFEARRFTLIGTRVKQFADRDEEELEPLVLEEEARLHRISQVANGKDRRNESFDDQVEAILSDLGENGGGG